MRPVMKSSPWPRRLQHLPLAMALVCISVVMTKPKTLIGLAIALCTIPFLFILVVSAAGRWKRRFGGSSFMNIIAIIIIIILIAAAYLVTYYIRPIAEKHFEYNLTRSEYVWGR